jgi:hypothetical protein
MGVEEEDRFATWLGDAEAAEACDALPPPELCSHSRYAYSPTAAKKSAKHVFEVSTGLGQCVV